MKRSCPFEGISNDVLYTGTILVKYVYLIRLLPLYLHTILYPAVILFTFSFIMQNIMHFNYGT